MKALPILYAFFAAAPCLAQPWVPVSCEDRAAEVEALSGDRGESVRARWQRFEAEVRAQRRGSGVYAPRPYPRNKSEVLEDFHHVVEKVIVGETPLDDLRPGQRRLVTALRSGDLKTEIVRVENWSPTRCSPARPKPYYHLLRLYDGDGELGRCALHDTGLLAECGYRTAGSPAEAGSELPPREGLADHLRRDLDLELPVVRPQYVTTEGLPFCSVITPCIAFRSGGSRYLLLRNQILYELDLARMVSETKRRQRLREVGLRRLGEHDLESPELSVGFGWVLARRVKGLGEPVP